MTPLQTTSTTEGAILGIVCCNQRLNCFLWQAARSLLRLDFAAEDKDRMHELAAKAPRLGHSVRTSRRRSATMNGWATSWRC